MSDLFGVKGRCWLGDQHLPPDEEISVGSLLRQLDFHGQELRIIDAQLGRIALERAEVKRLMTIPGVDATVALSLVGAVGDFQGFRQPERLVSYLGLNPRVRQSGSQTATHGRITRHRTSHRGVREHDRALHGPHGLGIKACQHGYRVAFATSSTISSW